MKIFVTTCDKFIQIMKGFTYMFNKHWSPDVEVTVLGYDIPPPGLPDNFKFVSLGKQDRSIKDWAGPLIPFFKQLPDEYFILILDDHYILNINKPLICEAEKHIKSGIDKVFLVNLRANEIQRTGIGKEKDVNFNWAKQGYVGRLSLHPQIVRRDYFLKHLRSGLNIWEYENNRMKSSPRGSMHDGAQMLIPKCNIAPYFNYVVKSKLRANQAIKISKEDLDALKRLGAVI